MNDVIVRAPASTANLAAGFDILGCALKLYSTLRFTVSDRLSFSGCDPKWQNTENLAWRAFSRMFEAAGGCIDAPSQRLVDFLQRRTSSRLNRSNYMGRCVSAPLHEILPDFVVDCLIGGFKDFDRRMHGFITGDASLLAVESRTSSPVRIPRDKETLQHPQLQGLYPCGEGAGYAGGIVSSALDGMRCVERISVSATEKNG